MENKILQICIERTQQNIESASDEWETISNIEKGLKELYELYVKDSSDKDHLSIVETFINKVNERIDSASDEWV